MGIHRREDHNLTPSEMKAEPPVVCAEWEMMIASTARKGVDTSIVRSTPEPDLGPLVQQRLPHPSPDDEAEVVDGTHLNATVSDGAIDGPSTSVLPDHVDIGMRLSSTDIPTAAPYTSEEARELQIAARIPPLPVPFPRKTSRSPAERG